MIKNLVTVAALLLASAMPPRLLAGTAAAPKDSPWGANYFPNVTLVNQDGKKFQFYDDLIKGKKVLIDFIYANCEKSCPLQTAKMAQVQKLLGSRVGRDIFMYSVTLDPERDTPEALKAYAAHFGAGAGWMFLTGKREDIDAVRFKLGERGEKEGHGNTVRVGDVARGQWMKLPLTGDLDWLATEIGKTLDPSWYVLGKPAKGLAEAPRRQISAQERDLLPGQMLFRNKCSACHTIGAGDRIGPDLHGITSRREHDWLFRYVSAPDVMRASKDSIAVELAKQSKVPMPNLALTTEDVTQVLNYLEARDSANEHAHHEHHHHD